MKPCSARYEPAGRRLAPCRTAYRSLLGGVWIPWGNKVYAINTNSGDSHLRYSLFIKKLALHHSSFFFKVSIMSTVILSRSYFGFQPHSARAQLSSILFGQLSAMA